jgi:hypothetical protein
MNLQKVIRLKGAKTNAGILSLSKIWLLLLVIWIKNMAYSKFQKIIKVCIPW